MTSDNPKILIIGGGWHKPQSYCKLLEKLESAGYEVLVPTLPSMNGDTEHIRAVAKELVGKGNEVVVLMHSYGGLIVRTLCMNWAGTSEEKGTSGGISHLIYLTAYAIPKGKAMIDGVKHFGHKALVPLAFEVGNDMSCVNRDPRTLIVGETDLPTADVDEYLASFVRWNGQAMYQPLATTRAAWRDFPVTYIHTTKDMTVPSNCQKWFVEEMRKEGVELRVTTLETGHCANFTAAKEVAGIMDHVTKGRLRDISGQHMQGTRQGKVVDAFSSVVDPE